MTTLASLCAGCTHNSPEKVNRPQCPWLLRVHCSCSLSALLSRVLPPSTWDCFRLVCSSLNCRSTPHVHDKAEIDVSGCVCGRMGKHRAPGSLEQLDRGAMHPLVFLIAACLPALAAAQCCVERSPAAPTLSANAFEPTCATRPDIACCQQVCPPSRCEELPCASFLPHHTRCPVLFCV